MILKYISLQIVYESQGRKILTLQWGNQTTDWVVKASPEKADGHQVPPDEKIP